jgi:hypothetical protein
MSSQLDPATFARAIIVESADIPVDMTIAEWRRLRNAQAPRANRRNRRRSRSAVPTATNRKVTVPSALRVGRSS